IIGKLATAQPLQGTVDNPPTVTLAQEVLATEILSGSQTPTVENTALFTSTVESSPTPPPLVIGTQRVSGSPTSVVASLVAPPSRPPSLTPRPSSTRLPTSTA